MEVQRGLVASAPERYWVPPYLGYKGWVAIVLVDGPDWASVKQLLDAAYQLVARPTRVKK